MLKAILTNKNYKWGIMKSKQSGVKLSLIIISIIILGVSAWFNQANAQEISVDINDSIVLAAYN